MNIRQRKRLIGLTASLVALGCVAIVVAGLTVPVKVAVDESNVVPEVSSMTDSTKPAPNAAKPRMSLAELRQLCATDLRRPLNDRPAPPTAAKGGSSSSLRLVGTIIEPGHSMAMFQKSDGSIELCLEGESIEDSGRMLTVTRIENLKATVQHAGGSYEMVVPPAQ